MYYHETPRPSQEKHAGLRNIADALRRRGLLPKRSLPKAEDLPATTPQVLIDASELHLSSLRSRYDGAMDSSEFHTPKFQTRFWRDMFADDKSIVVSECDWREELIQTPMLDMKGNDVSPMMVYNPKALTGKEGLVRLGKRYPILTHFNEALREGTQVADNHDGSGWVKVEGTLAAPNLGATENQLSEHGENHAYLGQRLGTFILLGKAHYVLTGKYPDIHTTSRLPGSWYEGSVSPYSSRMVNATHFSDGSLMVGWNWNATFRYEKLGGRFEIKRT